MRILLVVSMVPQADGVGAIPKLLDAQVRALRERNALTVVGAFGDLPGQAEAAIALMGEDGVEAHFADRRRAASPLRRWRVRAELAGAWLTEAWPWRAVLATADVQPILNRLADRSRYDVVVLEEDLMSVLETPDRVPVVLTEHEAFQAPARDWRGRGLRERVENRLKRRDWRRWPAFRSQAWRKADLIQVYSAADAAEIRRQDPDVAERVRVNPFSVLIPPAAEPAREEADTVLFSGTFTHLPNRDAALWLAREIMPLLRAQRPRARLCLVGHAPPRELRELDEPGVEVVADAPSVLPLLERAAVVVAPVRDGGGMRMKVLEAMALGKAVVTTSLGAEGLNYLDPSPPLAIADDAAGIAAATASLLGDAKSRHALGREARGVAERNHSPEAWGRRLEATYGEAIDLGRARRAA